MGVILLNLRLPRMGSKSCTAETEKILWDGQGECDLYHMNPVAWWKCIR